MSLNKFMILVTSWWIYFTIAYHLLVVPILGSLMTLVDSNGQEVKPDRAIQLIGLITIRHKMLQYEN